MPGIFESLKRLIMGEPVFKAGDSTGGWMNKEGRAQPDSAVPPQPSDRSSSQQAQRTDGVIKGNPSTFPQVYVRRTRAQVNGANQDVYCGIYNASRGTVELQDMAVAGRSRRLGGTLRAGEEREYLAYSGPHQTSESYHEAHLNYKTESGDYFQSMYDVEYSYQADKSYTIEELHLRLPIRDIYG